MRQRYSHIALTSEATRQLAISLGAAPELLSVNHVGIDPAGYGPREKQDFVFFSGKADRRKGTEDLLFVARARPHVRFRAMVWGPEVESLRNAAPPNIEFPQFERGELLRREFGAARIFFFPSVSETFGIAVVEAMASGCAVIASVDLPFQGEHIQPGDRPGMLAAIDRLWNNHARCAAMGEKNVAAAALFTWDAHIERLLGVYDRILNGGFSPTAAGLRFPGNGW